jgi:hypothetical protein
MQIRIEAFVRPDCVDDLRQALQDARIGPLRASVTLVRAPPRCGNAPAERARLELLVPDHAVERAIEAIRRGIAAHGERDVELISLALEKSAGPIPSRDAREW